MSQIPDEVPPGTQIESPGQAASPARVCAEGFTEDAVAAFLHAAGLSEYVGLFAEEGFRDIEDVTGLTDSQLLQMNIGKVGERARVLRLITAAASPSGSGGVAAALSKADRRRTATEAALASTESAQASVAAAAESAEAEARAHFALLRAAVDTKERQVLDEVRSWAARNGAATSTACEALRSRVLAEQSIIAMLNDGTAADGGREATLRASALERDPLPSAVACGTLTFAAEAGEAEDAILRSAQVDTDTPSVPSGSWGRELSQVLGGVSSPSPPLAARSPRGGIVVDRVKFTAMDIDGYFSARHITLLDKKGKAVPTYSWYYADPGAVGMLEFDPEKAAALEHGFHSGSTLPSTNPPEPGPLGMETDGHTINFVEMTMKDKADNVKKPLRLTRRAHQLRASSAAFGTGVNSAHATVKDHDCWTCKICNEPLKKLDKPPNGAKENWLCVLSDVWLLETGDSGAREVIADEVLSYKLSGVFREGTRNEKGEFRVADGDYTYDFEKMVRICDAEGEMHGKKTRMFREPRCGKGKWGCMPKDTAYGCSKLAECSRIYAERWPDLPPPVIKQRIGSKAGWTLCVCDTCYGPSVKSWSSLSTRPGEWVQLQISKPRKCYGATFLATAPCIKSKLGTNIPRRVRVEAFNGARQVFSHDMTPEGPSIHIDF